jgi:hypothetical protein
MLLTINRHPNNEKVEPNVGNVRDTENVHTCQNTPVKDINKVFRLLEYFYYQLSIKYDMAQWNKNVLSSNLHAYTFMQATGKYNKCEKLKPSIALKKEEG